MSATLTAIRPPAEPSVREVLQTHACEPGCLLSASPAKDCRCRCASRWHGAALAAITPAAETGPKAKNRQHGKRRRRRRG